MNIYTQLIVLALSFLVFPITVTFAAEKLTGQQIKTMSVSDVASSYGIPVDVYIEKLKDSSGVTLISPDTKFSLLHDNYGFTPSSAKGIAESLALGTEVDAPSKQLPSKKSIGNEKEYSFPFISISLLILYAASNVLVKMGKVTVAVNRRIWNIGLGTFFTSTALLGLLLVFRISYGLYIPLPFNILYWHVETGIAFSVIALFHIFWHIPYFKAIFNTFKK